MNKNSIYELAIVYRLDKGNAVAKTKDFLKSLSATILKEDEWGERRLAYPIRKETKGFYVFYDLEIAPENLVKIEESLNINEDILRYLIFKIDLKALNIAMSRPVDLIPAVNEDLDADTSEEMLENKKSEEAVNAES